MTWFPVVEREMRVAARRRATYRTRFWATLAMLGLFIWFMNSNNTNSARAGRDMLTPLSLWAFIFAITVGVIATSDSVSEEKREGTLGLLFLTDLRGHDVILGKLVAHSVNAFYALVSILPILGITLMMGGVTMPQFIQLVIALITSIVLSLSAGIFVSTFSRNERKAMVFTLLLLAAITCVPFFVIIWLDMTSKLVPEKWQWVGLMFSPGFPVGMAIAGPGFWPPASYWYSVALMWAGTLMLLLLASRKVPRSWTETPREPKKVEKEQQSIKANYVAKIKKSHRRFLELNPFLWLAMRGEASSERVWFFVLSIFVIWVIGWWNFPTYGWDVDLLIPTMGILGIGLKIWLTGEASRRLVEDRRNNAMEFLLSTPLTEKQIIRGQWSALLRQFLWPMLAILAWETAMANFARRSPEHPLARPEIIVSMIFLPLDLLALGWLGIWLGLTSKSRGRAMLIALVVVLLLPWALGQFFVAIFDPGAIATLFRPAPVEEYESRHLGALLVIGVLTDLAAIWFAIRRLPKNFRRLSVKTGAH